MSTDYYAIRVLERDGRRLRIQVATIYGDFAGDLPRCHNPAFFFTFLAESCDDFQAYAQTDIYDQDPGRAARFVSAVRCVELRSLFQPMEFMFLYPHGGELEHASEVPSGIYDVDFPAEDPRLQPEDFYSDYDYEEWAADAPELAMDEVLASLPAGFAASCAMNAPAGVEPRSEERERLDGIVTPEALEAALQPGAALDPSFFEECLRRLAYYMPDGTRDAIHALARRALAPGDARYVVPLIRATSASAQNERLLARTFSPEAHPALLIGWAYEVQNNDRRNELCNLSDPPDLPRICESAVGIGMSPTAAGWVLDNLRDRLVRALLSPERVAILFALRRHGRPEGEGFWSEFQAFTADDPTLHRAWLWMLAGLEPGEAAEAAERLRVEESEDLRREIEFLRAQRPEAALRLCGSKGSFLG